MIPYIIKGFLNTKNNQISIYNSLTAERHKREIMKLKDLVTKEHVVAFDSFRAGFFYYNVYNSNNTPKGDTYQFTVPVEDIGGSTLMAHDRAITFMRWIRKAIDNDTLIKVP